MLPLMMWRFDVVCRLDWAASRRTSSQLIKCMHGLWYGLPPVPLCRATFSCSDFKQIVRWGLACDGIAELEPCIVCGGNTQGGNDWTVMAPTNLGWWFLPWSRRGWDTAASQSSYLSHLYRCPITTAALHWMGAVHVPLCCHATGAFCPGHPRLGCYP